MTDFIDRRENPKGKNLPNRQRFIEREQERVRKAVDDAVANRKLSDGSDNYKAVNVDVAGTAEPTLRREQGGNRDLVLPGNREFVRGDSISRPKGAENGTGNDAGQGSGQDDFSFDLTRDEFYKVLFDGLELPDMVKLFLGDARKTRPERAGFSTTGSPTGISMRRTARRMLARHVSLKRPNGVVIAQLQKDIEACIESRDSTALANARQALEDALKQRSSVPWMDSADLRYNRFNRVPKPIARAVMFCLMDVSGSMSKHRKDLAKRFFMLLHMFLERHYKKLSIVFIRHTEYAEEVDENTFFNDPRTGGTLVSAPLRKMLEIQRDRFPVDTYNIFVAQASDGENQTNDSQLLANTLMEILPLVQYYAYIETLSEGSNTTSTDVWKTYESLGSTGAASRLSLRRVTEQKDIWPVFAELFARKSSRNT